MSTETSLVRQKHGVQPAQKCPSAAPQNERCCRIMRYRTGCGSSVGAFSNAPPRVVASHGHTQSSVMTPREEDLIPYESIHSQPAKERAQHGTDTLSGADQSIRHCALLIGGVTADK
jgi:hypothetical protein